MNKSVSLEHAWHRAAVIALAMGTLSGLVSAQTTVEANPADEKVITLSPFEVRASDSAGYRPKNTNSVTGINQDLKNLPFNIEIFGEEMINEIGARDLNSIVQFATNVNGTESEDGLQRTASFRGITSNFTRRNQFIWYNPSDSFSMGRVEIIRGPSSLLYGQGEPGGLINTESKQASVSRNFATFTNSISTWGEFRNTFDANIHAGKRFAVRVAGVYEDSDEWRDNIGRKVTGGFVNMHFEITPHTKFVAEYEKVNRDDKNASGILQWNPTTAEVPVRPADAPQTGNVQIQLLGGLNNPAVANGAITKENAQSWAASLFPRARDWEVYQFSLDHEFNKRLAIQGAYNVQSQDTDLTQNQGAATVLLLSPNLTNTATVDDDWRIAIGRQRSPSSNIVKSARVRAVTNFDVGPTHHDLVFGVEHRKDRFEQHQYQQRVNDGAATGGAVRPNEAYYIRDGIPDSYPDAPTNPVSTPSSLGYVWKLNSNIDNQETLKAGYAALMSKFLDERIHTLIGYRYDDTFKLNNLTNETQYEATKGSRSAGINFAATPELTTYFNYSESFKAPGAFRIDPEGNSLVPAIGSGVELGLKFDLFSDKVSGLLTFFRTDFDGSDTNIGAASVARNTVDPIGLNGRIGGNFVPTDAHTKGVELQFTADITKAWSVTFGYGYADARSKNDVVYQLNWNDGYLADASGNPLNANGGPLLLGGVPVTKSQITLNALGNISNAAALGLVGNGITGAKINQVTGQPTSSYIVLGADEKIPLRNEQNITMLTRYKFSSGILKGVSIGANARTGFNYIRGYLGDVAAGTRELVLGEDIYINWSVWAAYTRKFKKVAWTTRVQIDNPLDDEFTLGGYNAEYWNNPRQVRWSNTLSF